MIDKVSVVLRPLVKAGTPLGGGVLCDISATCFGTMCFLGLRVQPLGLGWTDEGDVVVAGMLAEGARHDVDLGDLITPPAA